MLPSSSSSSKWASRACTALSVAALVVLMSSLASAQEAAATAAVPECTAAQYLDAESNTCVDFPRPGAKASQDLSATLNSGNTAWMLTSSALVMIMTPGVAFFYAGLAGEEMASNTMMMSFVSIAMVSIQFFVFGYSVCFSSDGLFQWVGYNDVTGVPSGTYGVQIPHILFALFQTQFAMITPALLSGGIVGRMKFGSFVLFTLLWTSLVYDPLARWMWSLQLDDEYALGPLGWEGKMGSLDFAGGTVIHVSSGFGALVAAIVVGKRYNHSEEVKPHNVPLVMIGATLLWFGWFGFNAGSAGAADSIAAIAAINTHLAASAGFLTWIAMDWLMNRSVDPTGAASGAIAGLVSITPGCGYVMPWASVIFGVVGAIVAFACVRMKNYLRYDDTLDSFAIHGCAGFVGGLLTGLFATNAVNPSVTGGAFYGNPVQLWHQFVSQCVAAGYSSVMTFLILMALKYTIGIRVPEEKEVNGVDISYHGGAAYTNQSAHGPSSPVLKAANPPQTDFSALMTPSVVDSSEPKPNSVITNV
jgi:Amt family ammonium transporter